MVEPAPSQLADLLRDTLRLGNSATLVVTSNSMAPLLCPGDEVTLVPVRATDLKPGDIVTLQTETHLLTHRFWGWYPIEKEDRLLTKGDRPWQHDTPWPEPQLIGKIIARRRQNRTLSFQTWRGELLNRHLTWLASIERKCGLWERPSRLKKTNRPWPKRWLHQGVFMWATAVTSLLTSLP